jgi:hypothetical protein
VSREALIQETKSHMMGLEPKELIQLTRQVLREKGVVGIEDAKKYKEVKP